MSPWPAIEQLLPHRAPMLLLAEVLEHDEGRTRCRVDLARAQLFAAEDGSVDPWIGLEFLAQCVAAHAGLRAHGSGETPRPGLFLGTRRSRFHCASIVPDPTLCAEVSHLRGERGLAQFEARLYTETRGGTAAGATGSTERILVEGVLAVFLFDDMDAMRARLAATE